MMRSLTSSLYSSFGGRRPLTPLPNTTTIWRSGMGLDDGAGTSWATPTPVDNITLSAVDVVCPDGVTRQGIRGQSVLSNGIRFRLTIPATVIPSGRIQFAAYVGGTGVQNSTGSYRMACRVSADTSLTHTMRCDQSITPGWNFISIGGQHDDALILNPTSANNTDRGWVQSSTSINWRSAMVRVELWFTGLSAQAPEITIMQVTAGGYEPAILCIEEDDCWDTATGTGADTLYSILKGHGLRAQYNCIPGLLGEANYATLADVQRLYDEGNAICNHSQTHGVNTLDSWVSGMGAGSLYLSDDAGTVYGTQANIQDQYGRARDYISTNVGERWDQHLICASPFGASIREFLRANYEAAMAAEGLLNMRGTVHGVDSAYAAGGLRGRIFYMDGTQDTDAGWSSPDKVNIILNQLAAHGGMMRMLFHRIEEDIDSDSNRFTAPATRQVINHVANLERAGRLVVMPYAQFRAESEDAEGAYWKTS